MLSHNNLSGDCVCVCICIYVLLMLTSCPLFLERRKEETTKHTILYKKEHMVNIEQKIY